MRALARRSGRQGVPSAAAHVEADSFARRQGDLTLTQPAPALVLAFSKQTARVPAVHASCVRNLLVGALDSAPHDCRGHGGKRG